MAGRRGIKSSMPPAVIRKIRLSDATLPGVARVFNSAVMPYEGKFIGVFRGEQTNGIPFIYLGHSEDALHWTFDPRENFIYG